MKLLSVFSLSLLLCGCKHAPHTDNDDITTEWKDHTLVIKRKGLPIAEITNVSNTFFVKISGTDGVPDLMVDYIEDKVSGLAPKPTEVSRALHRDGGVRIINYDDDGAIITAKPASNDQS